MEVITFYFFKLYDLHCMLFTRFYFMIKKRAASLKYGRHNVWKRALILLHVYLLCSHSDAQHVDN